MKRIQGVFSQMVRNNSRVGCVCSSLLCLSLSLLLVREHEDNIRNSESQTIVRLASSQAPIKVTRATPGLGEEQKVRFVSQIIKQERPSHPDSDRIARIIVTESKRSKIDPLFVAAVVRAESMFRHKAVSPRGAQGLMQLMPKTGAYVAKLSNIELKQISDLHNPETNVKLGIWYLKHLEERFKGCREKLLVAYNWGPSNLRRALSNKTSFPKESVQYVERVLSHHKLWSQQFAKYAMKPSQTAIG